MLTQTPLRQQLLALHHSPCDGFIRLRNTFAVHSFPGWLRAQSLYPRIYWHGRGQDRPEYATLGCIEALTDPAEIRRGDEQMPAQGDSPRYFGGQAFDPATPGWPGFGPSRFVLPRVELVRRGQSVQLCLNLWLRPDNREAELAAALTALEQLRPEQPLPALDPVDYRRRDRPGRRSWRALVERVTAPDSLARLPKVVLSRRSRLHTETPVDPWRLLAGWAGREPDCFHFGFEFTPGQTFIGCSPERLYRREGRRLQTEALAGTVRRTGDEETDAALAASLLADHKNGHENRLVQADILARLAPLADRLQRGEPRVVPLRRLQHIKRDIGARLKAPVRDWQLLAALHPTPAVGGTPRPAALAFL
ncbi:isochorismate synthase, partial [Zobellella denitrificans]|uniref:isochorismate synthase n=1 Tax=Zobellella denitrificans TaxID=347534 RepID=UPI000B8C3A6D